MNTVRDCLILYLRVALFDLFSSASSLVWILSSTCACSRSVKATYFLGSSCWTLGTIQLLRSENQSLLLAWTTYGSRMSIVSLLFSLGSYLFGFVIFLIQHQFNSLSYRRPNISLSLCVFPCRLASIFWIVGWPLITEVHSLRRCSAVGSLWLNILLDTTNVASWSLNSCRKCTSLTIKSSCLPTYSCSILEIIVGLQILHLLLNVLWAGCHVQALGHVHFLLPFNWNLLLQDVVLLFLELLNLYRLNGLDVIGCAQWWCQYLRSW